MFIVPPAQMPPSLARASRVLDPDSRAYAVLLTGLPYAIFKLGTGWYLWSFKLPLLGLGFMLWGLVDMTLNLSSLVVADLPCCALSTLLPRERGLALDTLLTFCLLSGMIWNGCIPQLAPVFGRTWDVAVVVNILGVGVARVICSLKAQAS